MTGARIWFIGKLLRLYMLSDKRVSCVPPWFGGEEREYVARLVRG